MHAGSLYDRFPDEAAFRNEFVKPLLNRLGFFSVTHTHTTQGEQGRDFVFSEITRFGGVLRYAAVVKHKRNIHTEAKIRQEILDQIDQAMTVERYLAEQPDHAYRVNGVYVLNSGGISQIALEWLRGKVRTNPWGANVFFLDGDKLAQIDKWANFEADREIRQRLFGLCHQLNLNKQIWTRMQTLIGASSGVVTTDIRGSIVRAFEDLLTRPLMPDKLDHDKIAMLWQYARVIDGINSRFYGSAFITADARTKDTKTLLSRLSSAIELADELLHEASVILKSIRPILEPTDQTVGRSAYDYDITGLFSSPFVSVEHAEESREPQAAHLDESMITMPLTSDQLCAIVDPRVVACSHDPPING